MKKSLRRYTQLPFVMDYLQTECLTLLDPSTWDDKNDSFYIDQYSKNQGGVATAALCLTQSKETYHHWNIFADGTSGACIEFDIEKFQSHLNSISKIRFELVKYPTIKKLKASPPNPEDLPFLKRHAFEDEKEFRLFWEGESSEDNFFKVKMPISSVNRIILSPWLPPSVFEHVKKTLSTIDGCSSLKIQRSTLIENEKWKKLAKTNA